MRYLSGWHPFGSIKFDPVKITMWRCLVLQIWEQQKTASTKTKGNPIRSSAMTSTPSPLRRKLLGVLLPTHQADLHVS